MPLADKIRPQTLDDVVGQKHILGEGKVLRRIIESGQIPNLIFYGPSGVGKTTVARIIAKSTNKKLHKLNGTTISIADIKSVISELDTFAGYNGVLLYLDEIQYLNKKQQQTLLEYIEDGSITLIASTTENPYFYIYNAILSRCTVFEFKSVQPQEVVPAVKRAFTMMEEEMGHPLTVEDGVCEYISQSCGGDVRKSLNAVELCALAAEEEEGSHPSPWKTRSRSHKKVPCVMTEREMNTMICSPLFKNPCAAPTPTPRFTTWPDCLKQAICPPYADV